MSRGESRMEELVASAREDGIAPRERDALRARVWSSLAPPTPGSVANMPPRAIPPWIAPAAVAAIVSGAISIAWIAHERTIPASTREPAKVEAPDKALPHRTRELAQRDADDASPFVAQEPARREADDVAAIETREPVQIDVPRRAPHRARTLRATAETTPADEAALLLAARRARRDDPDAALRALDEHSARFANGPLAEEREMLAIDLLVSTGRLEQARARASALVERWPESVYRDRAERVIAERTELP
jgi:hypothetical protein